jgi:hypothetical protein
MKLITAAIQKRLQKNYETDDHSTAVLKLFGGQATWCITMIEPDGDTMWGLCDLNMDCIEYGTVSLKELQELRFPPFGLGIERDMSFHEVKIEELQRRETLRGC